MNYILKQYNTNLMKFCMENTNNGLEVEIHWIDEEKKHLLPLDLEQTNESLIKWLKGRTIPRNRAYVSNFLSRIGLNEKDTKGIIDVCQGLSLNDSYWIVEENCIDRFEAKNLYENSFSTNIASIAFTGFGSFTKSTFRSSPEFTTNGMLAKSWRRLNGKILLYKSGTEGFANSGLEPYSEFYAGQIAEVMGLNYVPYGLAKWKKRLCSTCELFTDINTSFIPIGRLIKSGGMDAVLKFYKSLGEEFYNELVDMLVFDAIILNEDRHFGNFGVLVDNKTNQIIAPAPIFDNGLSLLCYGMKEDFNHIEEYAATRTPATYQNFMEYIRPFITKRQKDKVRKLLDFEFDKNSRYKLPNSRLRKLEKLVQDRAVEILNLNG